MSKIKTLIGINIPMIETNEEGKLRGGFTALNISPRTSKTNGICSNSTSCSSNNVCSNLGTCHDNVICKSNTGVCTLNGECGNSSLPETPSTTTTTIEPTSATSASFGPMMF